MTGWALPLIKLARTVSVKPYTRKGKPVRGHTREGKEGYRIDKSSTHGKGVFSMDTYKRGDKIGIAFTRVGDTGNTDVDIFRTELGKFTNHSESPNVRLEKVGDEYQLVALTEIPEGRELLLDYNTIPWKGKIPKKEYAPGIPRKGKITEFPRLERRESWIFGLHRHNAKKAGLHYDLRIGDPITGVAYSWAIPKAQFPEPGKAIRVIRVDDHTTDYMKFEGVIPRGYGAGDVKREAYGHMEIVRSRPDAIWFNLYGTVDDKPQEFLLRQIGDKSWVFMNLTVTRKTDPHIPDYKPKYKDTQTEHVDVRNEDEVVQPKLDGAHVIVDMRRENKPPRVYSYRKSKRGTHDLIDHTHKFTGLLDKAVPKELKGLMLRGEAIAVKGDKVQPAEVTAGLLNSGVLKSREKQKDQGDLQVRIFDVVRRKARMKESAPYAEKMKVLQRVQELIPDLKMPETATTADEKARLISRIKSGKHPDTSEGVVIWNKNKPEVVRAKLRPDHDIYIRKIIEGTGKYKDSMGALGYSITPNGPIVGRVGTGFSDKLRNDIWKNKSKYLGKAITVRSQQQYATGALRAPSFYRFHPEK